ncbi:MAG: LuxR C-terminal-related transcriptional regulator [Terriglobia bacterium]
MKPVHNGRNKKIQVLIADREAVFRFGLRGLLMTEDGFRVVAEAENGTQALHMARQLKPDVIFLQREIASEKPGGLLGRLRAGSSASRIVITVGALSKGDALRHIRGGAAGVILKSLNPELFVKCARKVMLHEVWLPNHEVAHMAQALENEPAGLLRPIDTLTQREKTIISYLVQGWRNREIAEHLSISEQTVKNHLRAVYDKVGVSDRLELALYIIHQRVELPASAAPVGTCN